MHDGRWYVIFGNGYNNTEADGVASVSGHAVLYIVDLETKVLTRKIDLPAGTVINPNGLATPAVVDLDGDDIVDYAYAGDLLGNMWKFDLKGFTPASWDVLKVAGVAEPLFKAKTPGGLEQPITTRPQIGRGPKGFGQVVLFGTGKFMEPVDRIIGSLITQTFYGVYDLNAAPTAAILRGALLQQTVISEVTSPPTAPRTRVTSANLPGLGDQGWYMNLLPDSSVFQGEMQVTDSVLRSGRVGFTTLIPDTDPCGFGGSSWFMLVDALTGSRLSVTTFDLNKDKSFTSADLVGGLPVSGIGSEAIMSQPRFVTAPTGDLGLVTDTANVTNAFLINPGPARVGRQSWRQLR
jgi:type IV pilus assembly protein PilY1